jgi:uncharacterized membrane protein
MSAIPEQKRPWSRIALPVSILLNLFLLAVIGGHLLQVRNRSDNPGAPLARALSRVESILPKKEADAFGAVIRRDAPRFGRSWEQLREARQELNRQVAAEPFDPAAARQSLRATQAAWDGFLDQFSDTLVDGLAQISPEGRRKLISEAAPGANLPPDRPPAK